MGKWEEAEVPEGYRGFGLCDGLRLGYFFPLLLVLEFGPDILQLQLKPLPCKFLLTIAPRSGASTGGEYKHRGQGSISITVLLGNARTQFLHLYRNSKSL